MALRAVTDHPKTHHLNRLLREAGDRDGSRSTLGTLERMWHFAGRYTPQGNIGKYPDEVIEDWIGWPHQPGSLIAAFITARWIDLDEEYRLLVHDWDEGCDEATKKAVHRKKHPDGTPYVLIGEYRKNPGGIPNFTLLKDRKASIDPRFDRHKQRLIDWWAEVNHKDRAAAPWGSGTTKALVEYLEAEPLLTLAETETRLTHRFRSIEIAHQHPNPERGDINESANLYDVIRQLVQFSNGPVNGFGDKL